MRQSMLVHFRIEITSYSFMLDSVWSIALFCNCVFECATSPVFTDRNQPLYLTYPFVMALCNSTTTGSSNTDIQQTLKLLHALSLINKAFIDPESDKRSLFRKLLNNVLEITDSEYGFLGEVLVRDGQPYLKTYAITDISWDAETAALYQKHIDLGFEFTNLETLFGHTLRTGEVVIANNPATDSRSGGRPKGHPPLNYYLGIPIKDKSNKLSGMIGLANKPGGYSDEDVAFLSPMISLMSAFIAAIKADEAKDFFSNTLDFYKKAIDRHAIVSVTDTKGNILYVNNKFCEKYQYQCDELVGRDHRPINSGYHNKTFMKAIWDKINQGKVWKGEIKNKAKDGNHYWENKTIIPFLDREGKPFQFISISNDITLLKKQEEELNNLFNLSVDFLIIADLQGYFLRVSQSLCKALDYDEATLLSRPFITFVHPDDVDSTKQELAQLSAGASTFNFMNRYMARDGSIVYMSWKASVNKEDRRIYATAADITRQKETEQKLLQSKVELEKARAKEQFLSNMSHEIRTPLNAIIGFNDLLANTNLTEEQQSYLHTMSSALRNLNVIINDILDLSKLEHGKVELDKCVFNLEECIKQVVQLNQLQAQSKQLTLSCQIDPFLPKHIIGDVTRLSQILTNLLSNAIKFTPKGKVTLIVEQEAISAGEVNIRFAVADTGIGIAPDKLEVIFERFTQAEEYTTRVFGGTGLGLNIVKMLVDLHGGTLVVDSTLGEGSTFTFDAPFALPQKEQLVQTSETSDTLPFLDAKVLLVEDNFHNQQLACIYLERNGATVDVVSNGEQAIAKLKAESYDTLIMDIQMPVMGGTAATKVIRQELQLDVPIIGCSAHAMQSEKLQCLAIGMNDYITKPYTEFILVNTVHKHIKVTGGGKPVPRDSVPVKQRQSDNVAELFTQWVADIGQDNTEALIEGLVGRLPNDIQQLQHFADVGAWEDLRMLAHQLSGSLASLRLTQGLSLAKLIEYMAAEQADTTLKPALSDVVAYLTTLQHDMESLLQGKRINKNGGIN